MEETEKTFKLQHSQSRFSITLPSALVHALSWDKHTELVWKLDPKGKLYLIKKE